MASAGRAEVLLVEGIAAVCDRGEVMNVLAPGAATADQRADRAAPAVTREHTLTNTSPLLSVVNPAHAYNLPPQ